MSTLPHPVAIAPWPQGLAVVKCAGRILRRDGSLLDAIEQGLNIQELDVNDLSVGCGGLPNEDGIVELDAAIMHGPTHSAGSVMGLRNIKTPISVARRVMERTKHVNLVGEGALQFAVKEGFQQESLLTEKSLALYEKWKKNKRRPHHWNHDTMCCIARNAKSDVAAGCTTSGLGFKISGRVGDSPIIGAGLYADNDVGGAGATGWGEEILKVCASFLVVESMRQGHSPEEACEIAIKRMLAKTRMKPAPGAALVALRKDGAFGGAASIKGFTYAVWTPRAARRLKGKVVV